MRDASFRIELNVSLAMAGRKTRLQWNDFGENVRTLRPSLAEVFQQILEQRRPRSNHRPGHDGLEPADSGIRIPVAWLRATSQDMTASSA